MRAALVLLAVAGASSGAELEAVRRIAEAQQRIPWLWSNSLEGAAELPFTYEALRTRRLLDRRGREILPDPASDSLIRWRTLRLERIALDWGSHQRCLMSDGLSPCAPEWDREFERQAKVRTALSETDRARIDSRHKLHRERSAAFWTTFPGRLRFLPVGPDEIRFDPADLGLRGSLRFDPATHRLTRLDYEAVKDIDEPPLKLRKGDRYSIELTLIEGHSLPATIRTHRRLAAGSEESETGYSNFRHFSTASSVDFSGR